MAHTVRAVQHARSKRLGVVAATLVLAAGGLAGCAGSNGGSGKKGNEVLIGAPLALTGSGAAFAIPQSRALQLVVDAVNAAGGIKELGGAKVKLVTADTQSDPVKGGQLLRQMAAQHVSAFVGPEGSAEVVANKPLLEQLHIPWVGTSADDSITDNNKDGWIFRVTSRGSQMGTEVSDYITSLIKAGTIHPKKVGVVAMNIPPATSIAPQLASAAKKLGLDVTTITYDPTTTKDFSPIVAKLKAANVDLVTGEQYPNDAVQFAKAVLAQSWRPSQGFYWTSGGQYLNSFKKAVGTGVNGWVSESFSAGLDGDAYSPEVHKIAQEFQQKYGEQLNATAGPVASALSVTLDAIAKAKSTDPKKIATALRTISLTKPTDSTYPYYMSAGGMKFDSNQDNPLYVQPLIQLMDTDKQVVIWPEEYATGTYVPQKA